MRYRKLDAAGDYAFGSSRADFHRDTAETVAQAVKTRLMLARAVKRARGSLLWERVWPALALLATALGLFLALSWAGLWLALPPLGRIIGLVVFALLFLVAAVPLLRLRTPSEREGLRRLDAGSGAVHRPATSIADQMSANRDDPVAQALWQAHLERALLSAKSLKAGWPQPKLSLRDPMALRALVLLLVAATFVSAGSERVKRVTAAFDWKGAVAPANFRIDAWVTPPNYTGRPPVMLPGVRPGETAPVDLAAAPISVPAGSQLVVRSTGKVSFDIERAGGIEDVPLDLKTALPAGTSRSPSIYPVTAPLETLNQPRVLPSKESGPAMIWPTCPSCQTATWAPDGTGSLRTIAPLPLCVCTRT